MRSLFLPFVIVKSDECRLRWCQDTYQEDTFHVYQDSNTFNVFVAVAFQSWSPTLQQKVEVGLTLFFA